ncbi:MAG TPA: MoxR family ATPase [Kofleriaceae bacterium]|nr:MoxR family ATPase [Kofleriaceae bacterium]
MRREIHELDGEMAALGYIADESIATAVFLARELGRPLLVEGDAGVGKTEIARVWSELAGTELIRLQCYEGLDVSTALYEWNYPRQLLRVRMAEASGQTAEAMEEAIFSRAYLLERPLLRALTRVDGPAVLLIDEIDRADEAFEAFLLEVLSDFQVTIPELGTIRAIHVPHVVVTSNATREIGDALRRRCLYLYIDHPDVAKEVAILRSRVPGASEALAGEIARFVGGLRARDLVRRPGVAETIDWARALCRLHSDHLDPDTVAATLGCVIKDQHDRRSLPPAEIAGLVAAARAGAGAGAGG